MFEKMCENQTQNQLFCKNFCAKLLVSTGKINRQDAIPRRRRTERQVQGREMMILEDSCKGGEGRLRDTGQDDVDLLSGV